MSNDPQRGDQRDQRPQRQNRRPTRAGDDRTGGSSPAADDTASIGEALTLCHRCSFFFGGYRALYGADKPLVLAAQDGWIDLGWRAELRELLERSYGIELHSDTLHYEGRCEACMRVFVYTDLPIGIDDSDLPPVETPPALLMQAVPFNR